MGLLVASALLLASGFAKSLISKEENLNPADFNFGPQAALTAILFAVDKVVASSVDSRVDLQGAGVIAAALLSLLAALKFTQLHIRWNGLNDCSKLKLWSVWVGSNLFGYVCVVMVVLLKYPS